MSKTREDLFRDRAELQASLRPHTEAEQNALAEEYLEFTKMRQWPERQLWSLKQTQGINVEIIEPEKLRDGFDVVNRTAKKYEVTFGNGRETDFNIKEMHFHISANTVSGTHCKLLFSRDKSGKPKVEIQDMDSLNGTFIIKRPPIGATRRPLMEKEVRGEKVDISDAEFLRLGPITVLALVATNIYFEDQDEDLVTQPPEISPPRDMVPEMLADGWYFPRLVKMPATQ